MLVQLLIRNIVLIDRLDIEFNSSLSVLTGETGAGKSILLDALSLALGARGDGGLVREGAEQGQVSAVFNLPENHEVLHYLSREDVLAPGDISGEGGVFTLILRRIQSGDGRTRAYINDNAVSVTQLRQVGRMLVEIHGQHEERALLDTDVHREFLDAYGGLDKKRQKIGRAWKSLKSARKDYERMQAQVLAARNEAEYLRSAFKELDLLGAQPLEESQLADKRQMMMQAQNIAGELDEAREVLSGNNSAVPQLTSLARKLERKIQQAKGANAQSLGELLNGVIEEIDGALTHLDRAQNELDAALGKSEYDPQTLDDAEERLFALRAAARKFSVPVENLPQLAETMEGQLSDLDDGEEKLKKLKARCEETEAEYRTMAEKLSQKRAKAGEKLVAKVQQELPSLKLEQAQFLIDHQSGEHLAGAHGHDKIEYRVRTNPGTKSGPMLKVASGGELSRFLLALKVVLADKGSAPTLVFDEIDTGVGGAVADAIGRRLARLAKNVQVLSVTHAPQVAARARHHLLITKAANSKKAKLVTTAVVPVSGESRQSEIARMLAGALITDEARAAADRLLSEAL